MDTLDNISIYDCCCCCDIWNIYNDEVGATDEGQSNSRRMMIC